MYCVDRQSNQLFVWPNYNVMLIPDNSHVGRLVVPCVVNTLVHDLVQEVHYLNPYVVANRGLTVPASVVISLDYRFNKLINVSTASRPPVCSDFLKKTESSKCLSLPNPTS